MAEKVESKPVGSSASNENVMAAVASLPLIGLILYYTMKDASPIIKHYAKQSNALIAFWIVMFILGFVPILGWIVSCVLGLIYIIGQVLLIINALNQEEKYLLPLIGEYFDKLLK